MISKLSELKVLLVDDSFETINIIRAMLNQLGILQVYTAKDGKQALDFISLSDEIGDEMVNVILCDWNMPRLSGADLLRQIRTVDPDIPFIMITGTADYESVTLAKALGVTAYIAKPFSADQLNKKLSLVLKLLNRSSEQAKAS